MAEELLALTQKELDRIQVVGEVRKGQITQRQAAERLGLSVRQVKRLSLAYREGGAAALASKRRGQPSNHQLAARTKEEAVRLVGELYAGFGPTLAREKLLEVHGIALSKETLRRLMVSQGLWRQRRRKKPKAHPRRERRARRGELLQIDGSQHHWLEDRAAKFTLMAAVDDATGELFAACFVQNESTLAYFDLAEQIVTAHGRPLALYSDRHSVFRHTPVAGLMEQGPNPTQFARAMEELGCELICARSPEAKGRVERLFGTLQDRLVKELRLVKANTMEEANTFLAGYIPRFNKMFAVEPSSLENAVRPLTSSQREELPNILCCREERTLSKTLTLQYNNRLVQIETNRPEYALRYKKVQVLETRDGHLAIRYNGQALAYREVSIAPRQARVADSKEIAAPRARPRLEASKAFKDSIASSFRPKPRPEPEPSTLPV
jgi:transposase